MLIAPALPLALIHPTAWKWNSANFALTEFSEVRIAHVQHTMGTSTHGKMNLTAPPLVRRDEHRGWM